MTAESDQFEQKVERIVRLLEGDAKVTWDERFPDPDNPSQPRQVDITVRRDGSLTLVECRIHKAPQDVNWIEELIGRRVSLRAQLVIAVSASGFTEGAKAKAARFGIILRDFDTLTAEEIRDWGKKRKVKVTFYKFTDSAMSVTLPLLLPTQPTMLDPDGKPFNWRPLFSQIMNQIDERRLLPFGSTAAIPIVLPDVKAECSFGGMKALKIAFSSTVRRVIRDIWTTSVVTYRNPSAGGAREALVGALEMGQSEILEGAGKASIVIDVSKIKIPKSCLFNSVLIDFGRPVGVTATYVIGAQDALKWSNQVSMRFYTP